MSQLVPGRNFVRFDKRLKPRFWSRIDFLTNGCWRWDGAWFDRYGQTRWKGRQCMAHRVFFEALVGPIPDGLQLDHLCRFPACVNPDHLEPVTPAENLRRGLLGQTPEGRHEMLKADRKRARHAKGSWA